MTNHDDDNGRNSAYYSTLQREPRNIKHILVTARPPAFSGFVAFTDGTTTSSTGSPVSWILGRDSIQPPGFQRLHHADAQWISMKEKRLGMRVWLVPPHCSRIHPPPPSWAPTHPGRSQKSGRVEFKGIGTLAQKSWQKRAPLGNPGPIWVFVQEKTRSLLCGFTGKPNARHPFWGGPPKKEQ